MYEAYWGLREKPFENSPDPKYLFPSSEHRAAVEALAYAVKERKGGALLTGDYGCGKTLLIRVLAQLLYKDGTSVAVINYPRLTGAEMLREMLYQLGSDLNTTSKLRLSRAIGEMLHKAALAGKHTLLIIDEAQVIEKKAILEELRLLLNYQMNDRFLLTLLLVGQPELREQVSAIPQLDQRLAVRSHLHTFDLMDTAQYISYRTNVAGAGRAIFTDDAVEEIYNRSFGCPRRINNLGDMCLFRGFQRSAGQVDATLVKQVA